MHKTLPLILILLTSFSARAGILPDIFYADGDTRINFCQQKSHQNESFWRELMAKKIDSLILHKSLAAQNGLVSLSYLELYELRHEDRSSSFMSYVYANASHHLGRLVRFKEWPHDHELKKRDQELVKGPVLRLAAGTLSQELSSRLMKHSLNLYKELSWSLGASELCGSEYVRAITEDEHLRRAFESHSDSDFIKAFVTYEQSYLQETMYKDFLIGQSARSGMLDEMRFITFNGEENTSFKKWCDLNKCRTSSYDLGHRTQFDVWSIVKELKQSDYDLRVMNAKIRETADVFNNEAAYRR